MMPERKTWVDGKLVEEYYWSGKLVVYVDHHAVEQTYDEAIANARPPEDAERSMPFDGLFDSLGHDTDCDCEWCRQ